LNNNVKQVAFWVVLFLLILALFNLFSGDKVTLSSRTIPYSDFISIVEKGEVSGATLDGEQIIFQTATQQTTRCRCDTDTSSKQSSDRRKATGKKWTFILRGNFITIFIHYRNMAFLYESYARWWERWSHGLW